MEKTKKTNEQTTEETVEQSFRGDANSHIQFIPYFFQQAH